VQKTKTPKQSESVFGKSMYYTVSKYILQNTGSGANIYTETFFDTGATSTARGFGPHASAELDAQCRIDYKPTVGKYTGMTVMFDNGKEFTIKQGAGALYQISDGSGDPPSAHDVEGRAYTISSQLIITAAKGESVAAGEAVTITIPKTAGVSAPADLTAPVVAMQADSNKCTHTVVPNTDSVVSAPDLDTANTMTLVRKCKYAGMPEGDMSIAAKSTIRRVFASPLGTTTYQEGGTNTDGTSTKKSTATLGAVWPYKYDAEDVGTHLMGKAMDVYGSLHLLAEAASATAEETGTNEFQLQPAAVDKDRALWAEEDNFAGRSLVIGQEAYGMAAPKDITATARVIAVADATQIEVGDYLHVGDEMMYVESVDGNYIGVQRGVAGTLAQPHQSIASAKTEAANAGKQYTQAGTAAPAHGWVTIWKRDTSAKSYYLDAQSVQTGTGAADLTLNEAIVGMNPKPDGKILLVGGTSNKEFFELNGNEADKTLQGATFVTDANIDSNNQGALIAKPFIARGKYAHVPGDSVVVYTCGWSTSASTKGYETQGGVGVGNGNANPTERTNLCQYTTMLGLPVIPVKQTTAGGYTIAPGDYLRVDFPSDADGDATVDPADEEMYRVSAVNGNDVYVTHKPLASLTGTTAAEVVANVNRLKGGTNLDLIKFMGTSVTISEALAATNAITAGQMTASGVTGVTPGDYCLIDNELMMIKTVDGTTKRLTVDARPTATTTTSVGNEGRGAFGTAAASHAAGSTCHVYKWLGNGGNADNNGAGGSRGNVGQASQGNAEVSALASLGDRGFTYVYDPRTTLRHLKAGTPPTAVAGPPAYTKFTMETKDTEVSKDVSEVAKLIGNPQETAPAAGELDLSATGQTLNRLNTDGTVGESYAIDNNALEAGQVYLVGALGDMLEDVERDRVEILTHAMDKAGGPGRTLFATPWGRGSNVT